MRPYYTVIICLLLCGAAYGQKGGDTNLSYRLTQQPQFHGDLQQWLHSNIVFPAAAKEQGIEGRCYVQFMIDEKGAVSHIRLLRSSKVRQMDQEALRVVGMMPAWTPGYYKKRPVRMMYVLPVTFRLD